jgi:hypothetical protein
MRLPSTSAPARSALYELAGLARRLPSLHASMAYAPDPCQDRRPHNGCLRALERKSGLRTLLKGPWPSPALWARGGSGASLLVLGVAALLVGLRPGNTVTPEPATGGTEARRPEETRKRGPEGSARPGGLRAPMNDALAFGSRVDPCAGQARPRAPRVCSAPSALRVSVAPVAGPLGRAVTPEETTADTQTQPTAETQRSEPDQQRPGARWPPERTFMRMGRRARRWPTSKRVELSRALEGVRAYLERRRTRSRMEMKTATGTAELAREGA